MSEETTSRSQHNSVEKETCNILIIEDDAADRVLYKEYLQGYDPEHSYVFHEASSGQDGLKLFEQVNPDCILLDYMLPDTTGLDVLKEMAKTSPILPVVMLTGQGNEDIAAETIKTGAQNYISKNVVTAKALHRAITNTIDRAGLLNRVASQNEQLKKAKDKAEKADRSKSDFLATMSHEIRTPLNGIIGMAELMGYTSLSEKQSQYINSISTSGELLLTIINDILDFSKIEAGDLELEERDVDLKSLLNEIVQLLCSRAGENRVELIVRWPPEDDLPVIKADPVRLRQILINLVGNAIKFTKDGYVLLSVERLNNARDRAELRFKIKDTGIGIPENKIEHIFEQFSQVDSSTTREYGGTGLGLAICKRLVGTMDGTIGVRSEINNGSTFWFEIEAPVSEQASEGGIDYTNCLKDKKILIVDDFEINVKLLSQYLKITGADLEGAESAQDALDRLQCAQSDNAPFDLVLTDYAMPHMDGLALERKIAEHPEQYGMPKRILMVGLGKKRDAKHLQQTGFSAMLHKPLYPKALIGEVLKCLNGESSVEIDSAICHEEHEALPKLKAHVLIVDDDRISMRMSRSILDELGCSYDTAGNGQEALDILEEKHSHYEAVFMDWQMPIMDGHEAIKRAREQAWGKDLKIIALTANAIQGDKEKCLQAGADDYLSKPVRVGDVLRVLKKEDADRLVKAA